MSTSDTSDVLRHLKALTASIADDEAVRKQLYDAARELILAVEPPIDTIYRVIYSVGLLVIFL